jgi:hypothetical protein
MPSPPLPLNLLWLLMLPLSFLPLSLLLHLPLRRASSPGWDLARGLFTAASFVLGAVTSVVSGVWIDLFHQLVVGDKRSKYVHLCCDRESRSLFRLVVVFFAKNGRKEENKSVRKRELPNSN